MPVPSSERQGTPLGEAAREDPYAGITPRARGIFHRITPLLQEYSWPMMPKEGAERLRRFYRVDLQLGRIFTTGVTQHLFVFEKEKIGKGEKPLRAFTEDHALLAGILLEDMRFNLQRKPAGGVDWNAHREMLREACGTNDRLTALLKISVAQQLQVAPNRHPTADNLVVEPLGYNQIADDVPQATDENQKLTGFSERLRRWISSYGIPSRRSLEGVSRNAALQQERDALTAQYRAGATSEFSDAIRDFGYLLPTEIIEAAHAHNLPTWKAFVTVVTFLGMDVPLAQRFFQEVLTPNATVVDFKVQHKGMRSLRFANMGQLLALLAVGEAAVWYVGEYPYAFIIPWKTKVASKARELGDESVVTRHIRSGESEGHVSIHSDLLPELVSEDLLERAKLQAFIATFLQEIPVHDIRVTASMLRQLGLPKGLFDKLMYMYEAATLRRMPTEHEIGDWKAAQFYGALELIAVCYRKNGQITFTQLYKNAKRYVEKTYGK